MRGCVIACSVAAMEFLKSNPLDPVARDVLEAACGVGVVITREQIVEKVGIKYSI